MAWKRVRRNTALAMTVVETVDVEDKVSHTWQHVFQKSFNMSLKLKRKKFSHRSIAKARGEVKIEESTQNVQRS